MSCYPKYKIVTYYQTGENKGNRHEILDCLTIEEARARRQFYIKIDNVKEFNLMPTIWEFREMDGNFPITIWRDKP